MENVVILKYYAYNGDTYRTRYVVFISGYVFITMKDLYAFLKKRSYVKGKLQRNCSFYKRIMGLEEGRYDIPFSSFVSIINSSVENFKNKMDNHWEEFDYIDYFGNQDLPDDMGLEVVRIGDVPSLMDRKGDLVFDRVKTFYEICCEEMDSVTIYITFYARLIKYTSRHGNIISVGKLKNFVQEDRNKQESGNDKKIIDKYLKMPWISDLKEYEGGKA